MNSLNFANLSECRFSRVIFALNSCLGVSSFKIEALIVGLTITALLLGVMKLSRSETLSGVELGIFGGRPIADARVYVCCALNCSVDFEGLLSAVLIGKLELSSLTLKPSCMMAALGGIEVFLIFKG